MTEEERRQMAQQATSTLGRNLAVGGFGNPMTYTPPERPSPFAGTAEQFARMPEQAAAPSNLFGSMVAPKFPENYSQQLGRQQTMDLASTPSMAPVTDTISSFGNPMASRTERITSQYGTASTTLTPEQQTERFRTTQQAQQMGTMPRTPEQQQALLAQMRERGAAIAQNYAQTMQNFATERRANPQTYTTPLGASIAAPTNMFGQPIADFQQRYAQREERLMGQRASSIAALGATGFGAMQRQQASMTPPPIRTPSLFGGMGYASTLGGPQPAAPTFATGPIDEERRRRIFGTV